MMNVHHARAKIRLRFDALFVSELFDVYCPTLRFYDAAWRKFYAIAAP